MKPTKDNQPNQVFVEKLIENAIRRLKTHQPTNPIHERKTKMKITAKHTALITAALIVIAGTITAVMINQKQPSVPVPPALGRQTAQAPNPVPDNHIPLLIKIPDLVPGPTERVPKVQNLQPVPESQRPAFYVPKGTKNIALGKPVTGSDENPICGTLAKITDGEKSGLDGSYIEMGLFEQYVTIDLGKKSEIYAVLLWHYFAQKRVYFDVVIQTADDPDFTENVTTLFNNDIDNSLGLGTGKDKHYMETRHGKLIDAKGTPARYIRLHSCGNDVNELNHYIEVEVYGKP